MTSTVVVTGIGAVTPIGTTAEATWQAALKGTSGAHTLDNSWSEDYGIPVSFAATVDRSVVDERLKRVQAKRLDPSSQYALIAAREAWEDAQTPEIDPERLAVSWATGIGGVWTLLNAWDTLREEGSRRVMPLTVPMLMPNAPAAAIGMDLKARAAVQTVVSACASSTESLGQALDVIRSGKADVVIAGGSESAVHPITMSAFSSMQALSRRNDSPGTASRPYDVDRDGFVMGEGAGALVLETEEHAKARGAKIYAEIAGWGVSNDSHHITANEPEGKYALHAMQHAVDNAGIDVADIKHINAHATSTPVGDVPESLAVNALLGENVSEALVSATKSMTGHLLGGAGAVEAILAVLATHHRVAPPTINIENLDPEIKLNVVRDTPADLPSGDFAALTNSFGFGGHNAVCVIKTV
ncbi:beta-ketoacyl-[acyl-carrier-protein] synthase family protein [Brevibacterium luteolum]|uniref:beta-ketoacyl-[acyl-carrier-protein] synthase family protein n=1 Tax=Brevibacterium luteolum TaxID=199591 RepID=UPI00223A7E5F|nr:beta-ketoacyl-[acyl-carrier-protein] synthase family protein [Brevibacterium luteolum]MCT1657243.1 beta-ketoacyl-[acyl-carrier-protein] synthase family protein [Brevibacterium luteolum]MCT1873292.1 beta-ketoacyl-[acyl-carrier-protein] synthase family protein [Brevibacterium luteolum]MCT1889903.1 beta-ketoacyl-[acyl-carrier-protein] synthase family protein [Brevibacterium luteolum]MCT1892305.1 beta-ketoacyl-[acyl-carrier-protein] synthase family protein [Brevibacterium luteolum]MCT1923618.1 